MSPRNVRALNYYGGKASSAHKYPAPKRSLIIEPFAGGAGYSLLHRMCDVVLNDLNRDVVLAWWYLINASPNDVLALPLLAPHTHVDTLGISEAARALIRYNVQFAPGPRNSIAGFGADGRHDRSVWGEVRRAQLADIAASVKHWLICQQSYAKLPDVEATWFIDPPYQGNAGAQYVKGSGAIDFVALGAWCRSRKGQVIMCENAGADWLPFDHVVENRAGITKNADGSARRKTEVMYYQEN